MSLSPDQRIAYLLRYVDAGGQILEGETESLGSKLSSTVNNWLKELAYKQPDRQKIKRDDAVRTELDLAQTLFYDEYVGYLKRIPTTDEVEVKTPSITNDELVRRISELVTYFIDRAHQGYEKIRQLEQDGNLSDSTQLVISKQRDILWGKLIQSLSTSIANKTGMIVNEGDVEKLFNDLLRVEEDSQTDVTSTSMSLFLSNPENATQSALTLIKDESHPYKNHFKLGDIILDLKPLRFRVLSILYAHQNQIVARDQLRRSISELYPAVPDYLLDQKLYSCIVSLRNILLVTSNKAGVKPPTIESIRGEGYQLTTIQESGIANNWGRELPEIVEGSPLFAKLIQVQQQFKKSPKTSDNYFGLLIQLFTDGYIPNGSNTVKIEDAWHERRQNNDRSYAFADITLPFASFLRKLADEFKLSDWSIELFSVQSSGRSYRWGFFLKESTQR